MVIIIELCDHLLQRFGVFSMQNELLQDPDTFNRNGNIQSGNCQQLHDPVFEGSDGDYYRAL